MTNIDINAVRAELAQALSKKFDDSTGVAIYGAGDTAERWFNSFLDEEEITPKYFIDDTPSKRGTTFLGKPIVTFEEAHALCKSFVIVPCSYDARTIEFMSKSFHENPVEKGEFCSSLDKSSSKKSNTSKISFACVQNTYSSKELQNSPFSTGFS